MRRSTLNVDNTLSWVEVLGCSQFTNQMSSPWHFPIKANIPMSCISVLRYGSLLGRGFSEPLLSSLYAGETELSALL